jgi:hypothetical protein
LGFDQWRLRRFDTREIDRSQIILRFCGNIQTREK